MSGEILLVLLILLGLQIKHVVADYGLQSIWMLESKGRYGAWGGVAHAGLHAGLTAFVLLLCGFGLVGVALLAISEGVLHYHIDWGKERIVSIKRLSTEHSGFWLAIGLDQMLHQITYLGIAAGALMLFG